MASINSPSFNICDSAKMPLQDQQELISLYTSNRPEYIVKRFMSALTDKKIQTIVLPHVVKASACATLAGGAAGAAIGGCVGGPAGAIRGAAIGAGLLGASSVIYSVYHITTHDIFREWLGIAIKSEVFPIFLDFIKEEKDIQDIMNYYCSISLDYPNVPMLLSDGKTYEKKEIVTWLQKNTSSPIRARGNEFTIADLKYDSNYFFETIKKMADIRKKVLQKMKPEDIRSQGLEALYMNIIGDFKAYSQAYENSLIANVQAGSISLDEAAPEIIQTYHNIADVKASALINRLRSSSNLVILGDSK